MAPFVNAPETWGRPDWLILQKGFVTLYFAAEHFSAIKGELAEVGYQIVDVDAGGWDTPDAAIVALGRALDFPDYYGENMNALIDCLGDVAACDYGADPTSTGTVIALANLDVLRDRHPGFAWTLLNVLADTGRRALLFGHRFFVLAHSNDPWIGFDPVGATPVEWNLLEWTRASRGV